jgi:hypothetical protein
MPPFRWLSITAKFLVNVQNSVVYLVRGELEMFAPLVQKGAVK